MHYLSTRGDTRGLSFVDSLLTGLAPDGGLLIPEQIPAVGDEIDSLRGLDFVAFAKRVLPLFADDIETSTLHTLIDNAYGTFASPDVIEIRELCDVAVVELFHGPTLAFKDVALQLLGQLFAHVLAQRGERLNILGATSGDTGSAAIAGVRGQDNVDIFILYPNHRVSRLQELQMTTVPDSNVHCVAVEGSFDDCQNLMKETFGDLAFKQQYQLGAVNSVNWARIMAQVIYYGWVSLRGVTPVSFCVPTGNFGNVFAGYFAKWMGFPIDSLIVATNDNDILARFFNDGTYARGSVHHTLTPAMDIQIASNFERYLYFLLNKDTDKLKALMQEFAATGSTQLAQISYGDDFLATAVDRDATLEAIRSVHAQSGYVLDPHTAVGVAAARRLAGSVAGPLYCMATAHPAKFPEAVAAALPEVSATHPALDALVGMSERKQVIPADIKAVKAVITKGLARA
ncbi:MAG: threonine synthase [Pseudomonadota bacterium]